MFMVMFSCVFMRAVLNRVTYMPYIETSGPLIRATKEAEDEAMGIEEEQTSGRRCACYFTALRAPEAVIEPLKPARNSFQRVNGS